MDNVRARILENELRGKNIGKWTIDSLIDNGKSAAVFKGHEGSSIVAIKIFDQELIEKYGDATQIERIEREIALKGHKHPNLIQILGGGFDDGTKSHYIVMEFLPGRNLKKGINEVAASDIPLYVEQLSSAAEFLENLNIAHRDIKPENIILDVQNKKLTLLDLGVIRPIGEPGATDVDGILSFVGTLQYSPPEFLLREEEDTRDGWRAITFYQIGAVLHDLIMKRPLFSEAETPYANLVNAVQHTIPVIQSAIVSPELIGLAECCLLKDPASRVRLVSWEKFKAVAHAQNVIDSKLRVSTRIQLHQAQLGHVPTKDKDLVEAGRALAHDVLELAKQSFRSIRTANTALPPLTVTPFSSNDGLQIRIQREAQVRLLNDLTLCVKFEIIDPLAKALEIIGFSFAGPADARQNSEDGQWRKVFQGIYDGSAIHEALDRFAYACLDWGQQITDEINYALEM